MSFAQGVAAFRAKVKAEADARSRKVILELFRRVIERTPVLTGLARGSWSVNVGPAPAWDGPGGEDKSGEVTLETASGRVLQVKAGDVVWLANGLPYIHALEYGSSQQAPQGMVRISAAEFTSLLDEVVRVRI